MLSKKVRVVSLLTVMMVVFFVMGGCGKSSESDQTSNKIDSTTATAIADAKKATEARTGEQTKWFGPTTGPQAAKNKKIVYVCADARNAIEAMWGEGIKEAAQKIGWQCIVLDGKGTVNGQIAAFNQAIAMKVDGIITSANAEPLQGPITDAVNKGILVAGIHASAVIGPDPKLHLFYNCTSSGTEIGKALADYVIADSNGKGRVIILYDAQYAIAREKAQAMKDELAKVKTCKLLDYVNSLLGEVSNQMPQLASSWMSKFGPPFYVISIADYYYDFVTPTLTSGGVKKDDVKLLGSDGTAKAYERIRNGEYQIVTIPEPYYLQAYQVVDELNRGFNGQDPVVFQQPVYVVDKTNVDKEGGDKNLFDPSNNYKQIYAKIWGVQ